MTHLLASPEDLIARLRIEGPDEIDVEAIAEFCGATVVYERLTGCEARLIGRKKRAYITVNESSPRPEQRFSVAHELGHWMQDHREIVTSCDEKALLTQWLRHNDEFWNCEFYANHYGAGLLLPTKILKPLVRELPVTFDSVKELSDLFQAPLTVTAIRLVDVTPFPAALVCSYYRVPSVDDDDVGFDLGRIIWGAKSGNGLVFLPLHPRPLEEMCRDTVAFRLLSSGFNSPVCPPAADVQASQWFDMPDLSGYTSPNYTISEHSIKLAHNLVLSLLWWKDPEQIARLRQDREVAWEEMG
ncbi:MAG: ImmA/IrrE family metallo-endopeptidase [Acidobacteria bacterium]|nr:ImmA/IrrE family metallo-endopeptidase [Acidobacteriota bacterium]MCA1641495.1 ImmA/IrrE family metallo-endopeptidase [Acidobacteriota bacterium]